MKRHFLLALAAITAGVLLAGCSGGSDTGKAISSTELSPQQQIDKIKSDPSMPEPAKAAAIQQIQARQGSAAGGAAAR